MYAQSELTLTFLKPHVHRALRHWSKVEGTPEDLLDGLLLIRQSRSASAQQTVFNHRLATNQLLGDTLDDLRAQDPQAAKVLQQRFLEDVPIREVANSNADILSEHLVSHIQRRGVEALTQMVLDREKRARATAVAEIKGSLPLAADTTLFGIDAAKSTLIDYLLNPNQQWLLAIAGIGGIGKTALALAIAAEITPLFHFEQILWLTVESHLAAVQQRTPEIIFDRLVTELLRQLGAELSAARSSKETDLARVRRLLRTSTRLVIVDNVEDPAELAYLLNRISELANPSKFLVTTRSINASDIPVYCERLGQLAAPDAHTLIRHHSANLGLTNPFSDADLQQIYKTVAGNPLALKLVVGLCQIMPLDEVLAALTQGHTSSIETLYKRIYWQSWHTISETARTILLAMPLAGQSGIRAPELMAICDLASSAFWSALSELTARCLIDIQRPSANETRLHIHALTEAFLCNDVIQWSTAE